ncbi:MAG: type II toxin-antitoxin system VapC family toxin [Caldilineaceae bacterium]
MADYVTDTHALVWYLEDDKRLGPLAIQAYDACEQGEGFVYIPSICLVELIYLQEKGRIPATLKTKFDQQLASGQSIFIIADLTATVVNVVPQISRADVPELPDRVIAATAFSLQLPLITKDHRIQQSGVSTIW